jgi:hypothetical protein
MAQENGGRQYERKRNLRAPFAFILSGSGPAYLEGFMVRFWGTETTLSLHMLSSSKGGILHIVYLPYVMWIIFYG